MVARMGRVTNGWRVAGCRRPAVDLGAVQRRRGVALAEASHEDVLAVQDGHAAHALHGLRRVAVGASGDLLSRDGIDDLCRVTLVIEGGAHGPALAIRRHHARLQLHSGRVETHVLFKRRVGPEVQAGDRLGHVADPSHLDRHRAGGHRRNDEPPIDARCVPQRCADDLHAGGQNATSASGVQHPPDDTPRGRELRRCAQYGEDGEQHRATRDTEDRNETIRKHGLGVRRLTAPLHREGVRPLRRSVSRSGIEPSTIVSHDGHDASSVGGGKRQAMLVPSPSVLSARTRPPCASTMCRTIASPSPVPPAARERPGSTR